MDSLAQVVLQQLATATRLLIKLVRGFVRMGVQIARMVNDRRNRPGMAEMQPPARNAEPLEAEETEEAEG